MLVRSQTMSQTEMPTDMASIQLVGHIKNQSVRHLVAWWFERRGERLMPALRDVNPVEIPSTLAQIWLFDYLPQVSRFRYRLAGEEINNFWGLSLRDKYLDEILPSEHLASATKKCRDAVEMPAIVYDRTCLSLTKEITKYGERIILPLSDDGRTVNALLGVTHRDWFRDLEFDPYVTCSETTVFAALQSNLAIPANRDFAHLACTGMHAIGTTKTSQDCSLP